MDNEGIFVSLEELFAPPPPPNTKILDPWHSRPIDVHRWSEHPEVKGMVKTIWDAHFSDYGDETKRTGPKPKTSFRHQLRVLILDLYVAWLEDPELCIGVAMSVNYWDTTSRYNALNISKRIIPIIKRLEKVGLVDTANGSFSGPWAKGNRNTRIRASEALRAIFAGSKVTREDIHRIATEECIILRDGPETGDVSRVMEYQDTDATNKMRVEVQAYNSLLADTFIDIPVLEQAKFDRLVTSGKDTGKTVTLQLDHHHHFIRRIFSRGSWDKNGRFYGGWWQLIPSSLRKEIYINDTPTVEVDFKGLHIAILSEEQGVTIDGDPYTLELGLVEGQSAEEQRSIVKQLVLTALNARDRKSAFQSFRDSFPANHVGKKITNVQLGKVLDAFVARHPHLADFVCADQGIRLMNVDAQIAAMVQRFFTMLGIPVLSVHDSFIIDYTNVKLLKWAMRVASEAVVGRALKVSHSGRGLDEFMDGNDEDITLDFIQWCQRPRSVGYLERLANWEARVGREIIPYDRGV